MAEIESWARQVGEKNLWYDRFARFLRTGPSRSLLGCVNAERVTRGHKESNYTPGSWRKACEKWRWRERAEAWDEHQREQDAQEWEGRRQELKRRRWEVGNRLLERAEQLLAQFDRFLRRTDELVPDPENPDKKIRLVTLEMVATPHHIAQMAKVGSDLQAKAAGEPDITAEISGGGIAVFLPEDGEASD